MFPQLGTSPWVTSLRADEVPCLSPRARIRLLLASSSKEKPPSDSVCTESPACFLVRGQALARLRLHGDLALASSVEDKPPLVTTFGAWSSLPAPSCEDKPLLGSIWCTESFLVSLCEDQPLRGFAPSGRSPTGPPFSCFLACLSVRQEEMPSLPSGILGILPLLHGSRRSLASSGEDKLHLFPFRIGSPTCPDDKHISLVRCRFLSKSGLVANLLPCISFTLH